MITGHPPGSVPMGTLTHYWYCLAIYSADWYVDHNQILLHKPPAHNQVFLRQIMPKACGNNPAGLQYKAFRQLFCFELPAWL